VNGKQLLTRKIQFSLVYEKGKSWATREVVLRALGNGLDLSQFGFVVSKRIGNAVTRNRVKRRLREIVRKIPVQPGWDIVVIARMPAATAGFEELGQSVRKLLGRAGLPAGENEAFGAGTN
jgi:ribonuclease P protein component